MGFPSGGSTYYKNTICLLETSWVYDKATCNGRQPLLLHNRPAAGGLCHTTHTHLCGLLAFVQGRVARNRRDLDLVLEKEAFRTNRVAFTAST